MPLPLPASSLSDSYLDEAGGISYFADRLNTDSWDNASSINRVKALKMATKQIDRLNFAGDKAGGSSQLLQFPRSYTTWTIDPTTGLVATTATITADTTVPQDIMMACAELALYLLDGGDFDMEVNNLAAATSGIGPARSTYNRTYVQEHMAAGIPSFQAWMLLKGYLRDARLIKLSRV